MGRRFWALLAALTVGSFGASTPALADNPLGLYIGAGVGASNVGNNDYYNGYPYGYYGHYNNGNNVRMEGADRRASAALHRGRGRVPRLRHFRWQQWVLQQLSTTTAPIRTPRQRCCTGWVICRCRCRSSMCTASSASRACRPTSALPHARPHPCTPITYRIDQWNDKFAYGAGSSGEIPGFCVPRGI